MILFPKKKKKKKPDRKLNFEQNVYRKQKPFNLKDLQICIKISYIKVKINICIRYFKQMENIIENLRLAEFLTTMTTI